MKKFEGQIVLVTGAAGGIGACLAEQFAKAGAKLIAVDINEQALKERVELLKGQGYDVYPKTLDIADKGAVDDLASWTLKEFGRLDVLINNAGIGHTGELANTSLDTWQRLLSVNLWGALYTTYAFLPSMMERRQGQIVNVSSGQAYYRLPTWGAYAVIKLALGAFSEILHYEVKKHNIHVTTVYPFMVNTPFYKDVEADSVGARLSMKLLPYYSMKPERVGKIIFKATHNKKHVETVSLLNDLGYYIRLLPPISGIMSRITAAFLASPDELKDPASVEATTSNRTGH